MSESFKGPSDQYLLGPGKATDSGGSVPGLAAVTLSNNTNYLIYYDSNNKLACLWGNSGAGSFSNKVVQLSGATIFSTGVSPLAAVPLISSQGSADELRVYYVDQNSGQIKELLSSDGQKWSSGGFDNQRIHIAKGSSALAAASYKGHELKVFYQDQSTEAFVEAYYKPGQGWRKGDIQ